VAAFAGSTVGRLSGRPVRTALESRVTKTTTAAFGNHLPLPGLDEIADQFARVDIVHDSATRNVDIEIHTRTTCLIAPRSVLPGTGTKFPRDPKIGERVH
jgi:hypothetical protein